MLVGRAAERRVVESLVAGARLGHSGVLVVSGEAGIGKTALLAHAEGVAQDTMLLRATGIEAEQELPFGGLAQLLRPLVAAMERIPAPQAQALGVALALREGKGVDRFAVGAATLSLLTLCSEERPLGLIIDDAHLLDRPSSEAIMFAGRRLLADAIFILTAVRDGEPTPWTSGLPQLHLGGIDLADTRELVRLGAAGGADRADLHVLLHRLTAGNPLAILALAQEPERLAALAPGTPAPVPEAVGRLFTGNVEALDPDAKAAVLLAAASGGDLSVIARACSAIGIDVASLSAAEDAGLVRVRNDRVEFTHPLVRSSIYATATPSDRREVHRHLAAAVPALDVDRRAWHRSQAVLGPDDGAATDLDDSGLRARERGAHAVASTAYERAAQLSAQPAARARRLLQAAEAAWDGGDGQRAGSLAVDGLALDSSPAYVGRALRLQGIMAARSGSLLEAKTSLVAAADHLTDVDAASALGTLAEAVEACFHLGDARTSLTIADRLRTLLEAEHDVPTTALGTMAVGMARVLAGEPTDDIREAIGLLTDHTVPAGSVPSAWMILGPLFVRDSTTGRGLVRQAVVDQRARAAVGALPHLLFHIARDGATSEHWAGAAADYSEAIDLARELGQTTELAISLAGQAWLSARLGHVAACRDRAREALEIGAAQHIHLGTAWATFALGDLALGQGEADVAASTFAELTALLDEIGFLDVDLSPGPERVEALLRTGRRDEAAQVATAYCDRAAQKGQPWALARAERVRGLLAGHDEIDRHFLTALELHTQTLDVYEQARTRLAYGARLRRARRRVDARTQLRAAVATFDRLGARPWADAAADELSSTGETAQRSGSDTLDTLTPRELQISRLLAEGSTTRQAAAALFLSPKTVEYHLRNVYTKFGINSRAELSDRLSDLSM